MTQLNKEFLIAISDASVNWQKQPMKVKISSSSSTELTLSQYFCDSMYKLHNRKLSLLNFFLVQIITSKNKAGLRRCTLFYNTKLSIICCITSAPAEFMQYVFTWTHKETKRHVETKGKTTS